MAAQLKPLDQLSSAMVDAKPIDFDFGEGWTETWEIVCPDVEDWTADQCRQWLDDEGVYHEAQDEDFAMALRSAIEADAEEREEPAPEGLDTLKLADLIATAERLGIDADDDSETYRETLADMVRDEWTNGDRNCPMMNHAYPLDDRYDRAMLGNLGPLTVVTIHDEPYLALTGGGTDLSWEICAAYIALGYYPPAHFCDLPAMAGRGSGEADRHIIAACRKSLEILRRWMQYRLENLDRLAQQPTHE